MRRVVITTLTAVGLLLPTPGPGASPGSQNKVLFLGDSFSSGAFGRTFDTRMR